MLLVFILLFGFIFTVSSYGFVYLAEGSEARVLSAKAADAEVMVDTNHERFESTTKASCEGRWQTKLFKQEGSEQKTKHHENRLVALLIIPLVTLGVSGVAVCVDMLVRGGMQPENKVIEHRTKASLDDSQLIRLSEN